MTFGPLPGKGPDIDSAVQERFRAASANPAGLFAYPTGTDGLRGLGYPEDFISWLPEAAAKSYCGVGNPFLPGSPLPGQSVLDVGCGCGADALFAARAVGEGGQVAGLEFSPHMLEQARRAAEQAGAAIRFEQGRAEALPFEAERFDFLISNGVYNLAQDKPKALAEAFRVLKPGGRAHIADQVREDAGGASCPLPGPGVDPAQWAC